MPNLKQLANKLQMALSQRGEYIKVNQYQAYSPKAGRMVTKFVVIKTKYDGDRAVNVTLLETYQFIDVVKKLAEIYGGDSS